MAGDPYMAVSKIIRAEVLSPLCVFARGRPGEQCRTGEPFIASHKPTRLRELYHVLGTCSAATRQAICAEQLRNRRSVGVTTKMEEGPSSFVGDLRKEWWVPRGNSGRCVAPHAVAT